MAVEGISVPLAAVERMAVDIANDWGAAHRSRDGAVVVVGVRPRKRRPLVVVNILTRQVLRPPPGWVRVIDDGVSTDEGRLVVGADLFRELAQQCEARRRETWGKAFVEAIPAPQRITAAALRERGSREGWLR